MRLFPRGRLAALAPRRASATIHAPAYHHPTGVPLDGTFYMASAQLSITSNGNSTIGPQYVSRTLSISGGRNITIDYTKKGTVRMRQILLVE